MPRDVHRAHGTQKGMTAVQARCLRSNREAEEEADKCSDVFNAAGARDSRKEGVGESWAGRDWSTKGLLRAES